MAKRPYARRMTPSAEPFHQVTMRIPDSIYQRIVMEAEVAKVTVSMLLHRVLVTEYSDEEAFYERLGAVGSMVDAMDEEERNGEPRPQRSHKAAGSMFHESSTLAEEEPFPLASDDEK